MKNINNNQNLNFTQVKDILAQQAITIAAKEQLSSAQPSSNLHKVEQLLNETEEAVKILKLRQHIPFASSEDIEHLITKAEKGLILTPDDLEKVAEFLRVNRLLQRFLARHEQLAPLLNAYVQDMTLLPDIEDAIYTTIEHGQVRDEADRELAKMRRDLKKSVTELKTALNHFLTSKPNQKMIRDAMIVEKEGYATIPIKANYKNQLSGTIVAVSNGGQTVYFQPAKVVRLNQQITNLKAQIRNLELAILGALTAKIYDVKDDIKRNIELITLLDMIFARGKFAQKYNCIRPKINRENSLVLRAVRHPLIINPVPLTLELTQENSVLMITGPNAGGKTVALKTTGLMILMTELGLFLPSDKPCDIPLMDDVFTLIGDHQDLDNSLSTFSAEMKDIAMITKYAQFHSLVLLDELGTGTDPNEGSALAIGILQELYLRGCLIMTTTHYSSIKDFAKQHDGFITAAMDFDLKNLQPTYKLKIGSIGNSRALWIAKKSGIPENVLHQAEAILAGNNLPLSLKKRFVHQRKNKSNLVVKKEFHKGDIVYATNLKEEGIFYKYLPTQNAAKIFVAKEFVEVPLRRLQLRRLAKDLYPKGYNLDLLFVKDWQDYKFNRDLDRGSKKAYKKLKH